MAAADGSASQDASGRSFAASGEAQHVHLRLLEQALREFAEDASAAMQRELAAGAEIPFELASNGASRRHRAGRRGRAEAGLSVYRPLTGAFIAERWAQLRSLSSHAAATRALEGFDGLERYLAARGRRGDAAAASLGALGGSRSASASAERALGVFLADVFAEQSDLQLHEGRLRDALDRLDLSAAAAGESIQLLATLRGVAISSQELPLAPGLTIARPAALTGVPPEALWAPATASSPGGQGRGEGAEGDLAEADHLLVLVSLEAEDRGPQEAIADGVQALRELLRALRLFGDGRIALGPMGWARCGGESFETIAFGFAGRPRRGLLVTVEQEDELRAFCSLVSRRTPGGGALAWALDRFEMGCERASDCEALSDNLLALQALLEPQRGSPGLLAGRLAALCAPPHERRRTAERVLEAFELERTLIEQVDAFRRGAAVELAREIEGFLKALLSDVICGHLRADLESLADELLLSGEGSSRSDAALARPEQPGRRRSRSTAVPPVSATGEQSDPLEELAQGMLPI